MWLTIRFRSTLNSPTEIEWFKLERKHIFLRLLAISTFVLCLDNNYHGSTPRTIFTIQWLPIVSKQILNQIVVPIWHTQQYNLKRGRFSPLIHVHKTSLIGSLITKKSQLNHSKGKGSLTVTDFDKIDWILEILWLWLTVTNKTLTCLTLTKFIGGGLWSIKAWFSHSSRSEAFCHPQDKCIRNMILRYHWIKPTNYIIQ